MNEDQFIRVAMLTLLAIDPSPDERAACKRALSELSKVEAKGARAQFAWALMNHNDFVTVR